MNILLTGATGFLGSRTLEVLVNDPDIKSIIATGRTIKPTHTVKHGKVKYITGDLQDKAFVRNLFDTIDYVVHAAALSSPWGDQQLFENANIHTIQNLIEASKEHGIKRFVFISTPSMYFEYRDKFKIKESDPLPRKLVNQYAITKRKAEVLLLESGLEYVILRPRALIGRGDTVIMPRLIRAFDEGRLKIIGNGKNMADLTSVENVANAILLSLKTDATQEVYNITNGEPVVLWDVIAQVLHQLDRTPPTKKVPLGIVKAVAGFLEMKSKLTNNAEPALTKYGVGILGVSMTMDISKAQKLLGYQPKVTTQDALGEFIKWYTTYGK